MFQSDAEETDIWVFWNIIHWCIYLYVDDICPTDEEYILLFQGPVTQNISLEIA